MGAKQENGNRQQQESPWKAVLSGRSSKDKRKIGALARELSAQGFAQQEASNLVAYAIGAPTPEEARRYAAYKEAVQQGIFEKFNPEASELSSPDAVLHNAGEQLAADEAEAEAKSKDAAAKVAKESGLSVLNVAKFVKWQRENGFRE